MKLLKTITSLLIYANAYQINKLIFDKFKINVSVTTIYNVLHKNNISFKKVKVITNPYTAEEQKERLTCVKNVIESISIDDIVSYDEMSIITTEMPKRGWSPKGDDCIIFNNNAKIVGKRMTVGMGILSSLSN